MKPPLGRPQLRVSATDTPGIELPHVFMAKRLAMQVSQIIPATVRLDALR
ncbi:MAG: hypothetical protein WD875_09290 [Pirellulales bacterium]